MPAKKILTRLTCGSILGYIATTVHEVLRCMLAILIAGKLFIFMQGQFGDAGVWLLMAVILTLVCIGARIQHVMNKAKEKQDEQS